MALIRRFFPLHGGGSVHRTETDAGWARVLDGRRTLLYISTYGSPGRKSKPKPSQVIQLDRERALELARILEEVFPGLTDDVHEQ